MYRKTIIISLCILVSVNLTAFSNDTMIITLDQSVTIALEKNPELKIAEKEVAKARAGIWEAYSTLLPSLDGNVNFQHAWEIQTSVIPNFLKPMLAPIAPLIPELEQMPDFVELSFGLENTFMYGATLTQPLFLGGAGIAGVKMAYSSRRASQHQLESKKQGLIYQTINAFYRCLLARELVQVQDEALKQAEANLDIVLKKYEVGSASGFDKMRAEVEVANLQPVGISAKNSYQSALTGLRTVLGLPKETKIDVDGRLDFSIDAFNKAELNDLQILAFQNRPEMFQLDAQKTITSSGVALARSAFLPKLIFQTNYSFLAMRNDYHFRKDDFSRGFTSALSMQIPIFHGFKSHAQYQKARLDHKMVKDSEKLLRDGITAEVEIAFNKFKESTEKYFSAKESVSLAEEALRLANLMYEEGASTQLDVLSSQLALTRARLNHASALYEFQIARYGLRRATGTLKGVL